MPRANPPRDPRPNTATTDDPMTDDPRTDDSTAEATPSHREMMREVRRLGREAVRDALAETRADRADQLESLRETVRMVKQAERVVAEELRRGARGSRPSSDVNTRTRIQQIALRLFTENGYEATSLREIAEELGVTKAALYYHFKTKDEIVESLLQERVDEMEALIDWSEGQPRTIDTRREFLRRYCDLLHQPTQRDLMRFFERNQSSMAQHKAGVAMRKRMIRMLDQLVTGDEPLTQQIRSSLALLALHTTFFSAFSARHSSHTDEEHRAAALEVALDLIE